MFCQGSEKNSREGDVYKVGLRLLVFGALDVRRGTPPRAPNVSAGLRVLPATPGGRRGPPLRRRIRLGLLRSARNDSLFEFLRGHQY